MSKSEIDPIPEQFDSAEEAGEFWDTHSAADYWEEMKEVEMEFDLQKRVFLIPVSDRIYYRVKQQAEVEQRSVEEVVSALLERDLA
jgi:hypothetical protein